MKTKIELEYDYDDPNARIIADRLMSADEAWAALRKIKEAADEAKAVSIGSSILYDIIEIIDATRLEKVWKLRCNIDLLNRTTKG